MGTTDLNNESINEHRPNIRRDNDDQKMYLSQFNEKWSNQLIQKLQKYCVEEEYDMEAIAEDLETFEEENSMIAEAISKQYAWDNDTSKIFVEDLRLLISTDPETAKKTLSTPITPYTDD